MRRYRDTGDIGFLGRTVEIEALRSDGSEVAVELTLATAEASGQTLRAISPAR